MTSSFRGFPTVLSATGVEMDMISVEEVFLAYWKFFFLLTPFFVLTVFLSLTKEGVEKRTRQAIRVTVSIMVACVSILLFGDLLFRVMGLTIDAFRIGTGCLLFLSAIDLTRGRKQPSSAEVEGDMTVVPLTIPITVGPATIGTLLVLGSEGYSAETLISLVLAVLTVGVFLYTASWWERFMGARGLSILSKVTGLVLAGLSAQIVMTGVKGFLAS